MPLTLVEVLSALGDVEIRETYLRSFPKSKKQKRGDFTLGMYHYGRAFVEINPAPQVVSTLLHEMIHHCRPTWSERAVNRQATLFIQRMSDEEVEALYLEYLNRREREMA